MTAQGQWERFERYYFHDEELGFSFDISRMNFGADFLKSMGEPIQSAFDAMDRLERGAIANPDEGRMVGHYWLRAPGLLRRADLIRGAAGQTAAQIRDELERQIGDTNAKVREFVRLVLGGEILGQIARPFRHLLLVGIGGSALGPQLVAEALGTRADALTPHFLDNTDPDGISRVLGGLQGRLDQTLTVVISKSGETRETRLGIEEARAAYERENLNFAQHAVAVTQEVEKSSLFRTARDEKWLEIFPMWDWVGGRTSVTSAVGLLPAALQGLDTEGLLAGARAMDALTRRREATANPAALLALMWRHAGGGRGEKDMVILPYKDRLLLLGKYLQQLVMESLGKTRRDGNLIEYQGIAVYGNKGSTDQHAYVQQLREGLNNFFVTFIEVLSDEAGSQIPKEQAQVNGATAGDYLEGFLLGMRRALGERESMTITVRRLDAHALGMLIALFERAVGFYASLIGINAYHQPGVEAGKKAAEVVLIVQRVLLAAMDGGPAQTARAWSGRIGAQVDAEVARADYPELPADDRHEHVFKILERLAANPDRGVTRRPGPKATETLYAH